MGAPCHRGCLSLHKVHGTLHSVRGGEGGGGGGGGGGGRRAMEGQALSDGSGGNVTVFSFTMLG